MSVRVRFAPSPTGYLHIGGARTALFNWLYARHTGGEFILRIEDTDTARNTREAVDVILEGLRWLGMDWDEGPETGDPTGPSRGNHGPYFQSQRNDIYKRRIQELRDKGFAYDSEGAVKFRMGKEATVMEDVVVGKVRRELTDQEQLDPDFFIVRSDGQPVFHLVNVIDDLEMGVTHVIRGEDHLSNTAKHLALFKAFGVQPPQYGHIPLILNPDGSKMSKRDAGASLMTYVEKGYVPEAVVNYLLLLGWSPKNNREIMPIAEVIQAFDLPQILRHNAKFDFNKLNWLNYEYIRTLNMDRFVELGVPVLEKTGLKPTQYDPAYVRAALATCQQKTKVMNDLPGFADFYFMEEIVLPEGVAKTDFGAESRPRLEKLRAAFAGVEPFNAATVEAALKAVAAELTVKAGVLVHPVRLACTGKTIGPSLYHLMEVLGKERVLKRLDSALKAGTV